MKTLILSILALAVLAAGTGKRNYEWPHATQWYGYFTQDSSGGVTQAVSKTVAESTLTGDGFALKRNIGDTLTANVRGWQTASGHVDSARAAKVADSAKNLPTVGTAGTYRSVTTDAYGRVISGTTPTTLGPGYGVSYGDTVLANHYLRKDTAQTFAGALSQNGAAIWQSQVGASPSASAFYGGSVTPSLKNYSIAMSAAGNVTVINSSTFAGIAIAGTWIAQATSTGLDVTGKLSATGIYSGSYETITAAGAVSLSVDNSFVNSSSAITVTLANGGTAGQRKTISNFGSANVIVSYYAGTNSASVTLTPYASATWVSNGTYWAKQ